MWPETVHFCSFDDGYRLGISHDLLFLELVEILIFQTTDLNVN